MNDSNEMQNDQDNNQGLGNNLVGEENINYGGENEYQQHNEKPPTLESDHSFNVDKKFDNFVQNDNFAQREKKINQELDRILQEKSGFSISRVAGYTFMMNKILFLTTFTEFLFQRFDVVTLFLCIVVVLIEIGVFTHKHLYKWLAVLICSLLLDALVLIDISPAGDTYLESGAGSTMLKFGLLILLANIFLKLILGIGLWKMAMETKANTAMEEVIQDNIENNDIMREENTGRIFPNEVGDGNNIDLRESGQGSDN